MKDPDYYTWFQRCIEPMLILEAHNPSLMERRPSTAMSAVSNQWFETLFFIQWSDWPAIRSVSEEIDRVLQKFPASPNGWYPDISGAQAMLMVLKNRSISVWRRGCIGLRQCWCCVLVGCRVQLSIENAEYLELLLITITARVCVCVCVYSFHVCRSV